jgi:branched-chain amino acid transport system permease protein
MTVLGGFGSFIGPVVGSFSYIFLKDQLIGMTQYWRFWMGLILIILVVLFPRGISGLFERMWIRLHRSTHS